MERWRLLRSGPLAGGLNMAMDEVLLEEVAAGRSAPVLRLYRWQPPTLTLGYSQRIEGKVDLGACRESGIEVVRRPTGGRAVLHDREVTYAVISPEGTRLFPGGIVENYRVVAGALRALLASFGLEARLAPGRGRGGEGDGSVCFAAPSVCELVFRGCKMTGGAQRRAEGAFLQHGSLPVEMDLELLYRLLHPAGTLPPAEGARRLAERVGWLNRWLPAPVSVEEVERRLIAVFSERLGIGFDEAPVTPAEWERARSLRSRKYPNLAASRPKALL